MGRGRRGGISAGRHGVGHRLGDAGPFSLAQGGAQAGAGHGNGGGGGAQADEELPPVYDADRPYLAHLPQPCPGAPKQWGQLPAEVPQSQAPHQEQDHQDDEGDHRVHGGLAHGQADGGQRQPHNQSRRQPGDWLSKEPAQPAALDSERGGSAGTQRGEEYGPGGHAHEKDHQHRGHLLAGLGRVGHAQVEQQQGLDHHVDAEGYQGARGNGGNPVEQGEGNEGQVQQLVRQEHQADKGGRQQGPAQRSIAQGGR